MNDTETSGRDVVDVLTADHRDVEELIAQILGSMDPVHQRDLADQMIAELVRHSVAEEMFVYPAIRKHLPAGDDAAAHDVEEHKELETLMKKLEGADAGDAQFLDVMRQIQQVLADHVRDEESQQFPQLREHLPQRELTALAELVEAAKKVAPTRPHPSAPNSQLFHLLVGPGVGLVDRLRDRLTNRPT